MASPEHLIRLDTGAFRAARAARLTRATLYWLLLAGAAATIAVAIGVAVSHAPTGPAGVAATPVPLGPAPAVTTTTVAVWNASGVAGTAGRMATRVQAFGYPIADTRVARVHLRGRVVMYAPGSESAAVALARRLKLNPSRAVHPLDGIAPGEIAPAVLLILIGH